MLVITLLAAFIKSPELPSVNYWHCHEICLCAHVQILEVACFHQLFPLNVRKLPGASSIKQCVSVCGCYREKAVNSPLNLWTFCSRIFESRSSALNGTSPPKSFSSNIWIMLWGIQEEKIQMSSNIHSWINRDYFSSSSFCLQYQVPWYKIVCNPWDGSFWWLQWTLKK